jgi:putative tricarboxylic transport membrane protein
MPPRARLPGADLAAGVLLAAGGVVVLLAAARLPGGTEADPLGPRGFPSLLGAGLIGSGLAMLVRTLIVVRNPTSRPAFEPPDDGQAEGSFSPRRFLGAVVVLVLYVVALPVLGFLISTPAFLAGMVTLQGGVPRLQFVGTVVGLPVGILLLFSGLFGVPLPGGLLIGGT